MGRKATAAKVLVADVPELEDVFHSFFGAAHDVTYTPSYPEAISAIETNRYDLIIVGMHFDESRMFEVIRHIRHQGENVDTPVVGVRGMPTDLSENMHKAVEHAVEALGGNAFIAFSLERDSLAAACRAIERFLPSEAAPTNCAPQSSDLRQRK